VVVRAPCHAAEVGDVGGYAVLPNHGASGAEPAHRAIANAGDADYRALVIDGSGRGAGMVGQRKRRQVLDLAVLRSPDHGMELQDLPQRDAGRVMNRVLRPSHGLSLVVNRSSVTV